MQIVFKCLSLSLFLFSSILFASSDNNSSDHNVTETSNLLGSEISITHEGHVYACKKEDLIAEDMNGTNVYHCPTAKASRLENESDNRGTVETERLKQEIVQETKGVKQVVLVENNESTGKDKWVPFYYTEKVVKKVFPAKLYLSLRYGLLYQDDILSVVDNGTRGGFFYYHKFENELELAYHYEATVSFSGLEQIFGSASQTDETDQYVTFSTRLNYLEINKKMVKMTIGKYWSTYYDISGMTDKFIVFGGLGNGSFNAGTDGGGSGTGRASDVLQIRLKKDEFNLGVQAQAHQAFFSLDSSSLYDYCFGGSLFYKGFTSGVKVGVAVNYAKYLDISSLEPIGVEGNDHAYVAGLSYQKNKVSLDLTGAYTQNHVTDDVGLYFNSIGSELYMRYRITDSFRFAFGFNFLKPHDDDYIGEYNVEDYIGSLQYAFDNRFDKMVYLEGKLSNGHNADGTETSNAISLGFRYLLDY